MHLIISDQAGELKDRNVERKTRDERDRLSFLTCLLSGGSPGLTQIPEGRATEYQRQDQPLDSIVVDTGEYRVEGDDNKDHHGKEQ